MYEDGCDDALMSGSQVALRQVVRAAWISGTSASLSSTLALALCGRIDEGSAAGPINGPSQWLWGEAEARTRDASWRHTAAGYFIHHCMSVLWAALYERLFGFGERDKRNLRICMEAAALVSLAFIVDYGCTPRRLHPGFRKHLTRRSLFIVYASFAAGLALTSIARRRQRRSDR